MQGMIANNLPALPATVYHPPGEQQQDIATFTTDDEFDQFLQQATRTDMPEPVSALFVDSFHTDLPQALVLCQIALHPAGRLYLERQGLQESSDDCSRRLLDQLKSDVRKEMLQHPLLLVTGQLALMLPAGDSRANFVLPLPPVCFAGGQGALTPAEVDRVREGLQHSSRLAADQGESDAFHQMAGSYQQAGQPDIASWIAQQTNSLATLTELAVDHITSYLQADSPAQTGSNFSAMAGNKHLKTVTQPAMEAAKISARIEQAESESQITLIAFNAVLDAIKNLPADKRAPLLGDLAQCMAMLPGTQRQTAFEAILTATLRLLNEYREEPLIALAYLIWTLPCEQQQAAFDTVLKAILALPEMHQAKPLAWLAYTINTLPAQREKAFNMILKATLALRQEYQKFPLSRLASSINALPDEQKKAEFDKILTITLALSQEHQAKPLFKLAKLIKEPSLSDGQKQTALDTILNAALALPPQRGQAELLDRLAQLINKPWLSDKQKQAAFDVILNATLALPSQQYQVALLVSLVTSMDALCPIQQKTVFYAILKIVSLLFHHEDHEDLLVMLINSIDVLDIDQQLVIFQAILKETLALSSQQHQVDLLAVLINSIDLLNVNQRLVIFQTILQATLALLSQEYQAALLARLAQTIYFLYPYQWQIAFNAILQATQTLPPANQVTLVKEICNVINKFPISLQRIVEKSVKEIVLDLPPDLKKKIRIHGMDNR